jgi:hypothetical protein
MAASSLATAGPTMRVTWASHRPSGPTNPQFRKQSRHQARSEARPLRTEHTVIAHPHRIDGAADGLRTRPRARPKDDDPTAHAPVSASGDDPSASNVAYRIEGSPTACRSTGGHVMPHPAGIIQRTRSAPLFGTGPGTTSGSAAGPARRDRTSTPDGPTDGRCPWAETVAPTVATNDASDQDDHRSPPEGSTTTRPGEVRADSRDSQPPDPVQGELPIHLHWNRRRRPATAAGHRDGVVAVGEHRRSEPVP